MLGWIIFFVTSLWQLFAIQDGLQFWFNMPSFIAAILGFFIAPIPIVGTIVGMKGAIDIWGWSATEACLLFFGPMLIALILNLIFLKFNKN